VLFRSVQNIHPELKRIGFAHPPPFTAH
jgi:hypothetical protein